MRLKIEFEPSEDGGYTVLRLRRCQGCVSEGDTLAEARENVREAIALYLDEDGGGATPAGAIVEEVVV